MLPEHAQTIRQHFLDYWQDRFPQYPIQWSNEKFDPPDELPWVSFNLLPGTTSQAGLGGIPLNRKWRTPGVIVIQIFLPRFTGIGMAEEMVDAIRDCFQGKTTPDGVIFRATSFQQVGSSGVWYQINASTSFQVDSYG